MMIDGCKVICKNLKWEGGTIDKCLEGVNIREAQIDIQKHLKSKKLHHAWGVSSLDGLVCNPPRGV